MTDRPRDADASRGRSPSRSPRVARAAARRDLPPQKYERFGIALEKPPRIQTFELCRWLAEVARDEVLATAEARRHNVPSDVPQILQLDAWHHPDLAAGERPSGSETFQQLAEVLVTGDVDRYRPSQGPNTHWRHWPDGGRL